MSVECELALGIPRLAHMAIHDAVSPRFGMSVAQETKRIALKFLIDCPGDVLPRSAQEESRPVRHCYL